MTKEEIVLETIKAMRSKEFEYANRFAREGAFFLAEYCSTKAFVLHRVKEMIESSQTLDFVRSMYGLPKVEPSEEAQDEAD